MIENKAPGKDISAEDMASKFPLAARTEDKPKSQFEIARVPFGGDLIPVMAGPNTVENRDMILRGGAFKPLSFPYRSDKYFELREEGLRYLQDARDATGLPIITEVMDQNYVKAVAEVADILQISTRNMQNSALLIDCGRSGRA